MFRDKRRDDGQRVLKQIVVYPDIKMEVKVEMYA